MSRYATSHANPQGAGDSRPTALQIVKDENMENKLTGKVAVVTGVSSGIGVETVRALSKTGARLFLTARDLTKAKSVLTEIWDDHKMELIEMDQTSFESVRSAGQKILAKTDIVNILINNAGVMAVPDLQLTKDGYEIQFETNHLSHFLLFQLLKPALIRGSTPEFQSRVVMVSAGAHRISPIGASDDYNFQKSPYHPWMAYARSKTANVYMANEIERRYGALGLHATSLHPGIIDTGLGKFLPAEVISGMRQNPDMVKIEKTQAQGAATTIWAAISKELEGRGGVYLSNCAVAERGEDDGDMNQEMTSSYTYNEHEEARLWKDSLKIVGISDDN